MLLIIGIARAEGPDFDACESWYCCDNRESKYTVAVATEDCEPIISACRKALQAQQEEIGATRLTTTQAIEQASQAQLALQASDAKLQAWYRNPYFVSALGMLAGAVAAGYVLKH